MKKGQVESLVFTVVLVVVVIAILVAAIVVLVVNRGGQLQRTAQVITATTRPMAFASGMLELQGEKASVFENALQLAVSGRLPAAHPRVDTLSISRQVANAIRGSGFSETWKFDIYNGVADGLAPVLELGTFPKFCGQVADSIYPQNPGNTWAWCEPVLASAIDCTPGWAVYADGNGMCGTGSHCCKPSYNFTDKKYAGMFVDSATLLCGPDADGNAQGVCRSVCRDEDVQLTGVTSCPVTAKCCKPKMAIFNLQAIQTCGRDIDGWFGLCRESCAPGEIETDSGTSPCPSALWYVPWSKNQVCCKPRMRTETAQFGTLDQIAIPLLYADSSRSFVGKMVLGLGEPQVTVPVETIVVPRGGGGMPR